MATLTISKAFSELFSAPLEAVLEAEEKYLSLWLKNLKSIKKIYVQGSGQQAKLKAGADLAELIDQYAPTVRLEGRIETALTMRIAGVKETSGSASGGLSLGPIHASGGFGFTSRNTQESVFQASTSFALSNKEFSLGEYLKTAKVSLASAADLDKAIQHLELDLKSRPTEGAE
ncbi:hypothetical protein [Pelagicoccus albus]|uniref:Uncharacterized protein n=1 Tax=Pelagicoccus albus TaxID=415222 RepID=A0A7X1B7Y0_9BACT|nr:hypothetical protein [Pelagicoccus albus]MBC2607315.1 hypothetical protein [Pelagicoccus albus]